MSLTPEAKKLLAETIRGTSQDPEKGIRARLLRAIHDEADRRYRLSLPIEDAGLDETHRKKRQRIEGWVDEHARASKPKDKTELKAATDRLLAQAEKEAAATLVNRLVLLRHLEALGLSKPAVVTGGWSSKGYREFREFAPTLCTNGTTDATEGYGTLLQLLFDELAADLPGLFGDVGLTRLFPIRAATLRDVVERLDDPELASAWTDDTTLGWVYQYWNDPDREALDAKINGGGKIEPHEIASKTQMFTERYMVEWLLQNSIGLTWLAMCKKRGWTPDAERVLAILDDRRGVWRRKRDAGEVALDALMPVEGELEEHWKYYVPQPIPGDAVEKAPASVGAIKLLDPACGSGHFLVIAFDLLAALYREEGRHGGTVVTDKKIAESILENNLHGIDIDPRAIQIAAAGLYLKAKALANTARPKNLNLVAPVLQLGNLPPDDPAVIALRTDLKREVGIPEELTMKLLAALAGVDCLGSLLKIDAAIEGAIKTVELDFERAHGQGDLFGGFPAQQVKLSITEAKASILDRLERFLARHSTSEDLGLRLDGEQLAVGVRFVRMAKEGTYDLVVGNPPYSDTSLLAEHSYVRTTYPRGRANLYAAFLVRGQELVRQGGIFALLTMRGWMFQIDASVRALREHLLHSFDLHAMADLDRGAFEDIPDEHVAVVMSIFRHARPRLGSSVASQPTPRSDRSRDGRRTHRKRAALLSQVGRFVFTPRDFDVIEAAPIVYWWDHSDLARYADAPKLGRVAAVKQGMATTNNSRFLRRPWELSPSRLLVAMYSDAAPVAASSAVWVAYIKGAAGSCWFEALEDALLWASNGLQVKVCNEYGYGSFSRNIKNEAFYFKQGIAFSMIGKDFVARAHRFRSIFADKGSSVFVDDVAGALCAMNATGARNTLEALNPSIGFQVGDVVRLPLFKVREAKAIYVTLDEAFTRHQGGREWSVEFKRPDRSPWSFAQQWAQKAVDRLDEDALPPYEPEYENPSDESYISFALGVALGRFDAGGGGILDTAPPSALPRGILFLAAAPGQATGLAHPACALLEQAWREHGGEAAAGYDDLSDYLRRGFFLAVHKPMYENRPIYLPLSSAKKNFVAFVSIHRWAHDALSILLADYLVPSKRRLQGELDDLRVAKASGSSKTRAEKRFTEVQKLLEELNEFIARVADISEKGPPLPDERTVKREGDARYVMDLDDGVMVNSAALWPLLEPQWKDPKKWWKELADAKGKKDYDWSHAASRYFPTRVRKKCHEDPSLAVAHKCFWELHSAKAYAWELRLQDEIGPDFTIDEPGSDAARAKFLKEREREASEIVAKELKRREKKNAREEQEAELPFTQEQDDDENADD